MGLVINNSVEGNLAELTKFNDRIIIAHFSGNPKLTIIAHYSPCEGAPDAEEHYANLAAATTAVPKHNFILVAGDFNAHIGRSDAQY